MALALIAPRETPCNDCSLARGTGAARCPFVYRQRLPGEFLYFQGEPAAHVWYIREGSVVLERSGPLDRESPRAIRPAGSLVGIEALVRPGFLDTAKVVTRSVVCGAPVSTIDGWLGARGTPARVMLEQVLGMTSSEAPRGASVDGTAEQRVARWLLAEAVEGRAPPIPRKVVANLLGMVPETLSRALARLATEGAIRLSRRAVLIADRSALEAVARDPA